MYRRLATPAARHRILCGDFNTPQRERPDGSIVTWAHREKANGQLVFRAGRDERWERAELGVLRGLAQFDFADVYRLLHGYESDDFTWYARTAKGLRGRRFDHVFASKSLSPVGCRYLHTLREAELSDHAAVEVDFQPTATD